MLAKATEHKTGGAEFIPAPCRRKPFHITLWSKGRLGNTQFYLARRQFSQVSCNLDRWPDGAGLWQDQLTPELSLSMLAELSKVLIEFNKDLEAPGGWVISYI